MKYWMQMFWSEVIKWIRWLLRSAALIGQGWYWRFLKRQEVGTSALCYMQVITALLCSNHHLFSPFSSVMPLSQVLEAKPYFTLPTLISLTFKSRFPLRLWKQELMSRDYCACSCQYINQRWGKKQRFMIYELMSIRNDDVFNKSCLSFTDYIAIFWSLTVFTCVYMFMMALFNHTVFVCGIMKHDWHCCLTVPLLLKPLMNRMTIMKYEFGEERNLYTQCFFVCIWQVSSDIL